MCCFTGPVRKVSATQIFARPDDGPLQWLAYGATINADHALALVLPIPVPPDSPDDAVRFVDLSGYPDLFDALQSGFPEPQSRSLSLTKSAPRPAAPLAVVKVGSFEASFVPRVSAFDRLDPRFRMPAGVWDALPGYATFGFVVAQLAAGEARIHPLAFVFPRADPRQVFFPTVHVHDGAVHDEAAFDHTLYLQGRGHAGWDESPALAASFVDVPRSAGVVAPQLHVYRQRIDRIRRNEDIVV
ncbi:MAG: hypothetical protein ABMB14_16960 [Myxococcota bacterium]